MNQRIRAHDRTRNRETKPPILEEPTKRFCREKRPKLIKERIAWIHVDSDEVQIWNHNRSDQGTTVFWQKSRGFSVTNFNLDHFWNHNDIWTREDWSFLTRNCLFKISILVSRGRFDWNRTQNGRRRSRGCQNVQPNVVGRFNCWFTFNGCSGSI